MAAAGHDVHVYTTSVDGPGDLDVPLCRPTMVDQVKVSYFPSIWMRRLYWSPPLRRALVEAIPSFDVVHLHSIFLWPTSAAARIAEASGIPYLVAPRGMLVKELVRMKGRLQKTAWLELVERRTLRGASALHATSEAEAEAIRAFGYSLPLIEVVPNGVRVPAVVDRSPSRPPHILFLGRVSWKKGLDRLIEALPWLVGVQLQIAGNDEEGLRPSLEQMARERGVADRVHFMGALSGEAKEDALRAASLLVLPSYNENFGNVVLEALACGRPVAVTAEVGLAEAVQAAGVGRVIPGEPRAMGQALAAMLADAAALDAMGALGRRWVEQTYAWPAVARQMESVYERICSGVRR